MRVLMRLLQLEGLVLLHRNHCDRATDEQPSDPLNHLYGASVIAVYRSAWAVLAVAGMTYDHMPHPSTRISCLTHLVFTAVVCKFLATCRAKLTIEYVYLGCSVLDHHQVPYPHTCAGCASSTGQVLRDCKALSFS
jgi:hypothetical protein